ncbi:MAG: HD domain-containing protein [Defluviitaleaceae bacterium]|nr:HD domain-containing protein [Defluviitaleaceae bacterium]
MPKKKKPRVAAVIDIGSNELRLIIGQAEGGAPPEREDDAPRSVRYIESLSYPLGLGRDTFQTGKVSFEKTDKACEIIKNFLTLAREYGIRDIKTIATTAVREAENIDYILDQIKIKTGLAANVIDDNEEKNYIYKLLSHYSGENEKQSAMFVYIGAGNVGVSVLHGGRVRFFQNIKVGSLRIGELFEGVQRHTHRFHVLMEEYLASFTDSLSGEIPGEIDNFIVSGHEIRLIAELTGAETDGSFFYIPRDKLIELYNDIKQKTNEQITLSYGIDSERADVLLPAACIYQNLIGLTSAGKVTAAHILPSDAVLYETLYPKTFASLDKDYAKNTICSAETLARRFGANPEHYGRVCGFAKIIFDSMKKMHGLGSRDKLLLQTAAILHDIGKYINNREHYKHSFEIIKGSDIAGLGQFETVIVALICYYHSRIEPSLVEPAYTALETGNRMRVSKLAAILRLADALDRSHSGKFEKIGVGITGETLTVTVTTDLNIALELWSFNDKGRYFEEVFGIKAAIKVMKP